MGECTSNFWHDFWAGLAGPAAYTRYVAGQASERTHGRSAGGDVRSATDGAPGVQAASQPGQPVPTMAGTAAATLTRAPLTGR
jgi:hypothetical protein